MLRFDIQVDVEVRYVAGLRTLYGCFTGVLCGHWRFRVSKAVISRWLLICLCGGSGCQWRQFCGGFKLVFAAVPGVKGGHFAVAFNLFLRRLSGYR